MAQQSGTQDDVLRVRASSEPQAVAASIAHGIYEGESVRCRAIGAGAVNQLIKATVIAASFTAQRGFTIALQAGFETVKGNQGEDVTAIVVTVFRLRL